MKSDTKNKRKIVILGLGGLVSIVAVAFLVLSEGPVATTVESHRRSLKT